MPKNIDDMIVPERIKSIRNIPIPENRRRVERVSESIHDNFDIPAEERKFSPLSKFPKLPKLPRKNLWIAGLIGVVLVVFSLLSFFNGATISYLPKSSAITFNNDIYEARKSGEEILVYNTVKLSRDKGVEINASGSEMVSRKAKGIIMVYNDSSTAAQKLVENTRFETPEGLIYRATKAVTIPGQKIVNGTKQPGSLEVEVMADVVGEKYNIGLSDFTLPGLAGSSKFKTIYARSKTSMTGGFVGEEKVVKSDDKARVKTELETLLQNDLMNEVKPQVPEDFIMFPSLSYITYEELPQSDVGGKNKVMLNMRGHFHGVMFKKSDLINHLATGKITLSLDDRIDILNLKSLNLSFIDIISADLLTVDEIKFSVTGATKVVWKIDEVALKTDLAGRAKRELSAVLGNYPNIVSATATVRPFWKTSFPKMSNRITIKKQPLE